MKNYLKKNISLLPGKLFQLPYSSYSALTSLVLLIGWSNCVSEIDTERHSWGENLDTKNRTMLTAKKLKSTQSCGQKYSYEYLQEQ